METRIIEYRGKTHAYCNKPGCGFMVEMDERDYKPGLPCTQRRSIPPRPGVEEDVAEIPCGGTLVFHPISKQRNRILWTFDPKESVAGVPCGGRRVCEVSDVAPDDDNVAFFDGLVKSRANNDWFWAEDIEQALSDRDVLGAIERNADAIRKILGIGRVGRPPKED